MNKAFVVDSWFSHFRYFPKQYFNILPNVKIYDGVTFRVKSGHPITIGGHSIIREGCTIYYDVDVGSYARFGHDVFVRERVRIGDHCTIGTKSIIEWSSQIGDRVMIEGGAFISEATIIEDDCFISPNVVFTSDRLMDGAKYHYEGGLRYCTGASRVKRGTKIGANVTVLPELTIGENCVIGAGCVITKDVPDNSKVLAFGVKGSVIDESDPHP